MQMSMFTQEIIDELIYTARQKIYGEQENWYPIDAGNYDDAYDAGVEDGLTEAARRVLEVLGVNWKETH